jgi:hypothetical protein
LISFTIVSGSFMFLRIGTSDNEKQKCL